MGRHRQAAWHPSIIGAIRAIAFAIAIIVLQGRGAAAQVTCRFPGSSSTLNPPCTSSWVATSGFVLTADLGTGPTSATGIGASATTSFNLNQLSLTNTVTSGQSQGESRFLDTFMVTGGSGTGSLTLYWSTTGVLQQNAPPANCDPNRDGGDFSLGAASATNVTSLTFAYLPLCAADVRTLARTGSFSVPFTYGVPFVSGLVLSGSALNGVMNATGTITAIVLPAGAALTSGSGAAYPVTTSATVLLTNLTTLIQSLNLSSGIANSLDVKLQNALQALADSRAGNVVSACNRLDAFMNEVAAQSANALTTQQSSQLTQLAQDIQTALSCR
jgi:hypothetical protein